MAAVLAMGPAARASHRSAAGLLELRVDNRATVDVTVPRASARKRAGIDVHTTTTLTRADVTTHQGIPCTSVARTLVDLGDVIGRRGVERAVEQAEVLRVLDLGALDEVLARAGPRRGAGMLRSILGDLATPTLTRSELEECFLALRGGKPAPPRGQRCGGAAG
jgi:hypothetical protein